MRAIPANAGRSTYLCVCVCVCVVRVKEGEVRARRLSCPVLSCPHPLPHPHARCTSTSSAAFIDLPDMADREAVMKRLLAVNRTPLLPLAQRNIREFLYIQIPRLCKSQSSEASCPEPFAFPFVHCVQAVAPWPQFEDDAREFMAQKLREQPELQLEDHRRIPWDDWMWSSLYPNAARFDVICSIQANVRPMVYEIISRIHGGSGELGFSTCCEIVGKPDLVWAVNDYRQAIVSIVVRHPWFLEGIEDVVESYKLIRENNYSNLPQNLKYLQYSMEVLFSYMVVRTALPIRFPLHASSKL